MRTPRRIITLRSVEIRYPDLALAEAFFAGPWGLSAVARTDQTLYLAGTGADHHLLAITKGEGPRITSVTFRLADEAELEPTLADCLAAGATLNTPIGPAGDPAGGTGFEITDPFGRAIRVVTGDSRHPGRVPSRDRPVALTHVNINASDMDGSKTFFEDGLGMVMSDRNAHHIFLHCNPDHHTVVLANNGVNTMNHIAFLMPDLEAVMLRSGIMSIAGHPIGWGVGRHGPGNNVFSYFESPLGVVVEVTSEMLQVDETYRVGAPEDWVWPKGRIDQWGIANVPPESLRNAQILVPYGEDMPSKGTGNGH